MGMRFRINLIAGAIAAALVTSSAGCQTAARGPVPLGEGAATQADLQPWLNDAKPIEYVGQVDYVEIPSQYGEYLTWTMYPSGPYWGAEVDVRKCQANAERLRNKLVTVRGKLLERGEHRPLIIAESIEEDPQSTPATAEAPSR